MIQISRRSFFQYCAAVSTSLGVSPLELRALQTALAGPNTAKVLWLQGSGCTGCSVSFLNYINPQPPASAGDLLFASINLIYHPNLSAAAGTSVVRALREAVDRNDFILIVEGGVPTALNGRICLAWAENGVEKTFQQVVLELTAKTDRILCFGNCSAWGGILASGPNRTGVKGIRAVSGKSTINIAGCPPHPNWMVGPLLQLLQGKKIAVDTYGRPRNIYRKNVCDQCPLDDRDEAKGFGEANRCLEKLGCRGESTRAACPAHKWNHGVNWCMGAGAPCLGCTNPDFPGRHRLVRPY